MTKEIKKDKISRLSKKDVKNLIKGFRNAEKAVKNPYVGVLKEK